MIDLVFDRDKNIWINKQGKKKRKKVALFVKENMCLLKYDKMVLKRDLHFIWYTYT